MGGRLSRIANRLFPKNPIRIVMVGLDASGKTTILYKLKLGESVTTVPTIGIYVKPFTLHSTKFMASGCYQKPF